MVPLLGQPEAFEAGTRRFVWITSVVAGIVALTHQSLTTALGSAHRDSLLKAAHAMLAWPLPMAQPIVAGVAAFVLLGLAVQTGGWQWVTARQRRIVLGFAVAAVIGSGPTVIFCALTVAVVALVLAVGFTVLLVLFLLLLVAR